MLFLFVDVLWGVLIRHILSSGRFFVLSSIVVFSLRSSFVGVVIFIRASFMLGRLVFRL